MSTHCIMRPVSALLIVFITVTLLTGCPQTSTSEGNETTSPSSNVSAPLKAVSNRLLIKYHPEIKGDKARKLIETLGAKKVNEISPIGVQIVSLPEGVDGSPQIQALAACPEVAFAELDPIAQPDATVVNDSYASKEWHLTTIDAYTAWDTTMGEDSVIIAILDTGVNSQHPDLASKIIAGWNTYDNNADTSDVYGHGTAVAGAAAASTNNTIGVAAPAANCRIMPMRISDTSGLGYGSTVASALVWAADNGARVANVSFRFDYSATVTAAAQYFVNKGGVVTMSAGNDGTLLSLSDNTSILTVGATDSSDSLASFTNTGANIDLVAPGCGIYTTTREGDYAAWSGTSFSAPITAGVAALVIAVNPSLTGAKIQEVLKNACDDLGTTGYDTSYGWGRLNAAKAVALAASASTSDTTSPKIAITSPATENTFTGKLSPISVTVSATDNVGVTKVRLYVDGTLVNSSSQSPFTTTWTPTAAANGDSHKLVCKAYDAAGNSGTSAAVNVTLNYDTTAPTIVINAPVTGATITGKTVITVSSSDNIGVTQVAFYVDNQLYSTTTAAPFTNTWSPGAGTDGIRSLTCKAYDAAGNVGTSEAVTVNLAYDSTPPVVAITSPQSGSLVTDTVEVAVAVTDNVRVKKVQLMVDGKYLSQNLSSPFSNTWDTRSETSGSHTLYCRAFDTNGNLAISDSITVSIGTDTLAPVIAITSPTTGTTYSGKKTSIPITVSATDNEGITKTECYVDGVLIDTVTASPYPMTWTPDSSANGTQHTLLCKAYDAAGNVGISDSITVALDFDLSAPSIAIKTPLAGSVLTGKTSVGVSASDNVAVTQVELYVDNVLSATTSTAPFTLVWSMDESTHGSHTLTCKAYDAAGNVATSSPVPVTVQYDTTAPTVSINAPLNASSVSGMVNVTVSAKDNVRVRKVQLMVDGKYVGQNLAAPYTNTWDTTAYLSGTHTLYCRAIDDNGNVGLSPTLTVKK